MSSVCGSYTKDKLLFSIYLSSWKMCQKVNFQHPEGKRSFPRNKDWNLQQELKESRCFRTVLICELCLKLPAALYSTVIQKIVAGAVFTCKKLLTLSFYCFLSDIELSDVSILSVSFFCIRLLTHKIQTERQNIQINDNKSIHK